MTPTTDSARAAQNFRDWIRDAVNEHFAPDGLEATDEAIDQLTQILECRAEELAEQALVDLRGRLEQMSNAAEMLWVVVANASGGDWTQQSADWQEAAARWRDNYFAALAAVPAGQGEKRSRDQDVESSQR
jgi:hypothetical protein